MIYKIALFLIYAIEPCIFVDMCNRFLLKEPEKKRKYSVIGFCLIYGVTAGKQAYIFAIAEGEAGALFFLVFLSMLITVKIYKEKSIKKIIIFVIIFLAYSLFVDLLTTATLVIAKIDVNNLHSYNMVCMMTDGISKGTECLLYFLFVKKMHKDIIYHISDVKVILIYMVDAIAALFFVVCIFKKNKSMISYTYGMQLMLIILISYYTITVIRRKTKSEKKAIHQVELMKQNEILTNQAMDVRDELRSLRHDMRSHYNMIIQLVEQDKYSELKDYVKNIKEDIDVSNDLCMSDNMALSVVLTKRMQEAKQKNINFEHIITTDSIPISLFDQNILYNNILSNAIEACQKQEVLDKHISFSVTKNMYKETLIECSNTIVKAPIKKNGVFITTKSDSTQHGIGFKNIQKVVKKNHGKIIDWISDEGKVFHIQITFRGDEGNGNIAV